MSAGKGKIKRVSNVPIAAGLLACLFLLTPDVSAADVDRLLRLPAGHSHGVKPHRNMRLFVNKYRELQIRGE